MSRVLGFYSQNFSSFGNSAAIAGRSSIKGKVLSMREKKSSTRESKVKGSAKLGLVSACFMLVASVIASGAFYLYQVNDLATQGYEMREIENQIQGLEKESKKMRIREVELRSMYNIEKATENLDLVNAVNVSYVEMESPVAMK
ncbi:MAG TPA: hypothetical protein PLK35_02275 [Candidatus Moranbacteria bacterium]|nr:hypothetical protein [Candidatus Moranbacteria bacterium]